LGFSPDYFTARRWFLQTAAAAQWTVDCHQIEARGPAGAPLWVDAASSPPPGSPADPTLIVSSGLHGIEGLFGSAVQLALLEEWRSSPCPVRCVLVHALNPYGFAWLRRTDERNVDLNRNFLLDGEPYAGSPRGYAALDAVLNPQRPPSRWDRLLPRLLPALAFRGVSTVRRAVASGQYDYPRGLFYGGHGPSATRRLIGELLPRWIHGSREVMHLDIHTGLGRWAAAKLLIDYAITDEQRQRLAAWFGEDTLRTANSSDLAYTARGGFGRWCVAQGFAEEYLFAYAEFGTFSNLRVLAGLRVENQAHHWLPASRSRALSAHALKELFCPSGPAWRAQALANARAIVTRAANGLASASRSR
jgi:hypothetical protein